MYGKNGLNIRPSPQEHITYCRSEKPHTKLIAGSPDDPRCPCSLADVCLCKLHLTGVVLIQKKVHKLRVPTAMKKTVLIMSSRAQKGCVERHSGRIRRGDGQKHLALVQTAAI